MIRYLLLSVFIICFVLMMNISGQVFDYRYDESPAVSLNGISMTDSRQLSMGGISLAASGHAMQIGNPAWFPEVKGVEIGFSYGGVTYESFQFRGINEGVRKYPHPLAETLLFPASLAVRFGYSGFSLTAGWYRSALNEFPDFSFLSEYDFDQSDELSGTFTGSDESYFISAGFSLSEKVNAGVKLEYKRGTRFAEVADISSLYYFLDGYWQLKDKRSGYTENNVSSVIIPEIGVVVELNPKLKAALKFSYPLKGKAERTVTRTLANSDGLNILDHYIYDDDHFEIPRVSASLMYTIDGVKLLSSSGRLILVGELTYLRWSEYKFIFFGEELARDTADTFKISAGAEYGKTVKKTELLFRIGAGADRQPVREPGTVLMNLSAGFGINYMGIHAGIGVAYYHGSAGGVAQNHLQVCTSFSKVL